MIEMSGGEDRSYRLGYAGDTLNTASRIDPRIEDRRREVASRQVLELEVVTTLRAADEAQRRTLLGK